MDHSLIALAVTDATANVTMIKAAALLGSGIGVLGVIGPGVGIGLAGSRALEGMARQPEMATKLLVNCIGYSCFDGSSRPIGFRYCFPTFQFCFYSPIKTRSRHVRFKRHLRYFHSSISNFHLFVK